MHISRLLMLLAAGSLAAVSISLPAQAQSANTDASSRAKLRPPADSDAFRERLAPSPFGLKPQPGGSREGIALPFSLNYSRVTRSIMMPLDEKNTLDVGVMLNVNSAPGLEPATSPALGLQPKRTPGILLQKKF